MQDKGGKDLIPNNLVMEAWILYKGLMLLKVYTVRRMHAISFISLFMLKDCGFQILCGY